MLDVFSSSISIFCGLGAEGKLEDDWLENPNCGWVNSVASELLLYELGKLLELELNELDSLLEFELYEELLDDVLDAAFLLEKIGLLSGVRLGVG